MLLLGSCQHYSSGAPVLFPGPYRRNYLHVVGTMHDYFIMEKADSCYFIFLSISTAVMYPL